MTAPWTNNAEGGTVGGTVTAANSGGASGRPFDLVNNVGGDQLTYDNTYTPGGLAYKADTGPNDGSGAAYGDWQITGSPTSIAGRIEMYIPAPGLVDAHENIGASPMQQYLRIGGTSNHRILFATFAYDNDDETFATQGWHETSLHIAGGGGTLHVPSSEWHIIAPEGTLPVDQWFRLEFAYVTSNPGSYHVAVYPDQATTTPSWTRSGAVTWNAPWTISDIRWGPESAGSLYWFDNISLATGTTTLPGPTSLDGWLDILGAASSPLSFIAKLSDDQKLYRAKYTSTSGVATSAPATLTVTASTEELPDPPDPTDPPEESGDWPIDSLPDAIAPAEGAGSSTVLDLVRRFSAATRRTVRIVNAGTIEMVNPNVPYLPSGFTQADAESMYHAASRTAIAGERTLSLEETDLSLSATADLVADDVRVVASDWRLPAQLPCYGLRPAPVRSVSYTFSPDGFSGSMEFDFPIPSAVVRRS